MSLDVYQDLDTGEFVHVSGLEDADGWSVRSFVLTLEQAQNLRFGLGDAL